MNRKMLLIKWVKLRYRTLNWVYDHSQETLLLIAVLAFLVFKLKEPILDWYQEEKIKRDFYYRYYDHVSSKIQND